MGATAETIELLKSIDASLKHLVAFHEMNVPKATATDKDLDSPHGNPEIKAKDPRDWTGPTMIGKRFSDCPATYLDLLAERYDFFNAKETNEQKRKYNALDAARARGWAARVRAGYKPPVEAPAAQADEGFPSDMMTGDEIDF